MNDLALQTLAELEDDKNIMANHNTHMTARGIIEYLYPNFSANVALTHIGNLSITSCERFEMWNTIIGEKEDEDLSHLSESFLSVLDYENPDSLYRMGVRESGDNQTKKDLKEIWDNYPKMRLKKSVESALERLLMIPMEALLTQQYEYFVEHMLSTISGLGITKEILYQINLKGLGEEFLSRRPLPHKRVFG